MTDTAQLQTMRHGTDVACPQDRVQHALAGERDRWFAAAAEIHSVQVNDGLRFAWELRGATTQVAIELRPTAAGTRVEVTHSGVPERPDGMFSVDDVWTVCLDNLRRWCELGQEPSPVTIGPPPAGESRSSIEIAAPAAEVFDALTDPRRVSAWCGGEAAIDPTVGGRYDFGWQGGGPIEILNLDSPNLLAYSWAYPTEPETVVRWELEGSQGRTRLTVIHTGFGDRPVGDYQVGWLAFLTRIRNHVEQAADRG